MASRDRWQSGQRDSSGASRGGTSIGASGGVNTPPAVAGTSSASFSIQSHPSRGCATEAAVRTRTISISDDDIDKVKIIICTPPPPGQRLLCSSSIHPWSSVLCAREIRNFGLLVISVLERHASKDTSNRKAPEFRPGNCHPVFLKSVPPQMKTVENHSGK